VLWTSAPPVSFASETVSFESIWLEPRPVQRGGVPLWFGGGAHEATARRIAELGVGWIPVGVMAPDELARGVDLIRVAFADAGRDPAHLGVRAGLAAVVDDSGRLDLERTLAPVPELEHVGVTVVSLGLGRFLQRREDIVPFLNEVAAAVH
jgi:alkanesulfonate monooxygenase SsuD/methylene tetrahydromethanopterin reductase-like flavin-dependent oxidoreductase (luciferase family)